MTNTGRMVVSVDRARCSGHARCASEQAEFFLLDDEGYSDIGERVAVPTDMADSVRRGVAACPEEALTIQVVVDEETS